MTFHIMIFINNCYKTHQSRVSSNSIVEAAAETLRESTTENGCSYDPFLSIITVKSAAVNKWEETPFPSEPKISRTRFLPSFSRTCLIYWTLECGRIGSTPVATTWPPWFFQLAMNYVELPTPYIFMSSIAPEDVLLTVLLSGQWFFLPVKTAEAPKKRADLRIAPKFCGSVILSQ